MAYGQLDESEGVFRIIYEAKNGRGASTFQVKKNLPAIADSDYYLRAARAINLGIETLGRMQRSYNVAALPTARGEWFVYLYPAPTESGIWPLGGDVRYLVSRDGRAVLETRKLHKTIIEFVTEPEEGGKAVAGAHTHILECIPEDTDVSGVMSRRPPTPEYIICDSFFYAIDEDGTVRFIGYSDEFWGDEED